MPDSVYRVIKLGDTAVGGTMNTPPAAAGMPPAWGCYVTVADADATAKRCIELGGKVVVGPQDVPGAEHHRLHADVALGAGRG